MPSNEDDDDEDDDNKEDSDEEEEDDNDESEDDDDDNDVDSTNEINEAEKKAAELLLKEKNALNDIALIQDIFFYVDRTSKRIIRSLTVQEELKALQEENKRILELLRISQNQNREEPQCTAQNYSDDEGQGDNESVTWSQYEELNDGQRAQLLERSLELLNNNVKNASRRTHSDERKRDYGEERRSKDRKHGLR